MKRWALGLALVAVVALHLATLPRTFWEYDEHFFALGVEHYQPLLHHPPPPGAPLYIGFAKLIPEGPFDALLLTSALFLIVGFAAWALALDSVPAAILLYTSPALLISGMLPQSDTGAIALLGIGAWASAKRRPALCALFCAAAVGWRPQIAVAALALFAATAIAQRSWRALLVFTIACLAWFVPLVFFTGGPLGFFKWLSGQAAYYAQHDADLSRSGQTFSHIALRFLAHPWGPKWLDISVLALALFRLPLARKHVALAAMTLIYLTFAIATMDPADAVRYAIPALPFIALLAASSFPRVMWAGVVLYAIGAVWYCFPILHARATQPSPPAAAMQWIQKNIPRDTVILYDLDLRPHAENTLRAYRSMPVDAGLKSDINVPLVLFADGERGDANGVTFRWPDTDAYRKLTRQHYGAVSVIPIPVRERYRVVQGIFAPERTRDGRSWRWLSRRGIIALPNLGATQVRLTFRAPPEYPLASNRVHVNGATVELGRDRTASVVVPYAPTITIDADQVFVPAEVKGANNRDTRRLSVMLTRVEQIAADDEGPPAGRTWSGGH